MVKYLDGKDKLGYYKRLIDPYTKHGVKKLFIEQYLNADGNELLEKFWNKKSSSRFAFDLYSWMGFDDRILDFEFEFKLPGMASGGKTPNMDVFIELDDRLIFIESKFSELANYDYIYNEKLSPAYWSEDPYGKENMSLKQRYHDFDGCDVFADFIKDVNNEIKGITHDKNEWFSAKQETCHLVGIWLYLQQNPALKKKKICLYNIFWNLMDDKETTDMAAAFEKNVRGISSKMFPGIDFEYSTFTVQEMLEGKKIPGTEISFPDDMKSLLEPFEVYSHGLTRSQMSRK